ncbi:MAG: hypothetical protein HY554_19455, partial [Elusimicrobia bacterium]|nr:hypothetical protein [Elusimicrobiota bacterium]
IYADGAPAAGLFVHDVGRALWGRLGPYSTRQWMDAARGAVRHLRDRSAPRDGAPALAAGRPRRQ